MSKKTLGVTLVFIAPLALGRKGPMPLPLLVNFLRKFFEKFLEDKVFWLLPKISSIDVFFPLKYGAINSVFMIIQKLNVWKKSGSSVMA